MALIRDGAAIDDAWVTVGDDDGMPDARPAIITLERWRTDREALIGRNAPLGVRLGSDQSAADIVGDLDRFAVVALEFPVFTDGRAFTSARLLRERYGYTGEVRAVGNVLRDQVLFMLRCGFDAFEMKSDDAAENWRAAIAEIDVFYQAAADRRTRVVELRHS
jgi:uncharacterized protein (DUF934 family)